MSFAERFKELRKKKGLSQNELAERVQIHFTQVSRYERGETKPNAAAMAKLARVLDTTVDYLMHGSVDEVTADAGLDKEIINRFKQVQELNKEDKKTVLSLLDAYIAKEKIKSILQ